MMAGIQSRNSRDFRKALKTQRRRKKSHTVDPKYGRWMPKNRYNIDQVPVPFVK